MSQPQSAPANTYSAEQGSALALTAQNAGDKHLVAAADYIVQVFQANNIKYAIMGGFSLMLRGNKRETHDVDVAIGCTMQRLKEVLSPQARILRPAGPVAGVMRVFIKVGGQYNAGLTELNTEVDLILRGSLGAPDDPSAASEAITANTPLGQRSFLILNLPTIVAGKLNAFFARGENSDFIDIGFLIGGFFQQIYAVRTQLNQTHRQHYVTEFERRNPGSSSANRVRSIKYTLGIA
ncbi:MAG: hypothetical protein M1820_002788 [Bogoriella megaspora]|nr:MAG: hypothetical protein M1820_002788 [Bogoriella megaspora]